MNKKIINRIDKIEDRLRVIEENIVDIRKYLTDDTRIFKERDFRKYLDAVKLAEDNITNRDKEFLSVLPFELEWIARQPDGNLVAYDYNDKPTIYNGHWYGYRQVSLKMFNDFCKFITYGENQLYNIKELLNM